MAESQPHQVSSRERWLSLSIAVVLGAAAIALIVSLSSGDGRVESYLQGLSGLSFRDQVEAGVFQRLRFVPVFLLAVPFILLLERTFPAKVGQPLLGGNLAHDGVWCLLAFPFEGVVVVTYVSLLKWGYESHLSFLTVESLGEWPPALRFFWGVLLADFLGWLHHRVRHAVPWLWQFHVVHHSQRTLNMFTDLRYHPVEYIASRTISTLPLLMFAVDTPRILLFTIFHLWFTRFYHSNIRASFGPLRFVFVTPQSHRLHHSIEGGHQDRNFGILLSVWDRLFGTQHREHEVYPATGVDDPDFPLEGGERGWNPLRTVLAQLAYPFRRLARSRRT